MGLYIQYEERKVHFLHKISCTSLINSLIHIIPKNTSIFYKRIHKL